MIVFASSVTSPDQFRRFAEPGIELAREPDAVIIARQAEGSIFSNYNAIMDQVAGLEGLEALVLLHQDSEIVDPEFLPKLRAALAGPEVGLVGCVGAVGVRSIAWWEGSVTWASFIHRYAELGGGGFPSLTWDNDALPPYARLGEVETLDGFVLGMSPWVVQNIRFDESLGSALHGYDFDFCLQVRESGHKVVTADLKVIHNHSLELASDLDHWMDAHVAVAQKWDGRMPGPAIATQDWKYRARRAEAEAAVTRANAASIQLKTEAAAARHEREMAELTGSLSWRLTAPLRRLKAFQQSRPRRSDHERSHEHDGDITGDVHTVMGRRIGQ